MADWPSYLTIRLYPHLLEHVLFIQNAFSPGTLEIHWQNSHQMEQNAGKSYTSVCHIDSRPTPTSPAKQIGSFVFLWVVSIFGVELSLR